MQLVMAVSTDGYVAKSDHDDMSWTGRFDKNIFKLLTYGKDIGLGAKTYDLMMDLKLPHRRLHRLSRERMSLPTFCKMFPAGVLVGGLTLAEAALDLGLLDSVILSHVPKVLGDGIKLPDKFYLQASATEIIKFDFPTNYIEVLFYDNRHTPGRDI